MRGRHAGRALPSSKMGGTEEGGEGPQGKEEEKTVIQTNKKDVLLFYRFTYGKFNSYKQQDYIFFIFMDIFIITFYKF